jgi:hypothetical protein
MAAHVPRRVELRDHMLVFQREPHVIDQSDPVVPRAADRKRFGSLVDEALAAVKQANAARFKGTRGLALSALGTVNQHHAGGPLSAIVSGENRPCGATPTCWSACARSPGARRGR